MTPEARNRWWVGLIIALLLGLGLWWLLSGEYVDEQVQWPGNPALNTEKFHMTGRWLNANGFQTHNLSHLQDLDMLPAAGSLLIVHDDLGRQAEIESRQLEDWLRRGGSILATAPLQTGVGERSMLNPHGIYRCPFCPLGPRPDEAPADDQDDDWVPERPSYQRWTMGDADLKLRSLATLKADPWPPKLRRWFSDRDQTLFARYSHEGGQVTLIADNSWLGNWALLDADHAEIVLALIDPRVERIYLQQRAGGGGLLNWLWRQSPLLWSLAALLLALWIWSKLMRLGPILEEDTSASLQFREQLLASARFDWRHNRGRQLLLALREAQLDQLLRRYPDWRQLDRATRLQHLKRLLPDLSEEALDWFLDLSDLGHQKQLLDYVRIHQQLIHAL